MTGDHHYSDHPSHCVTPRSRLVPGLSDCQAGVLPTRLQRELDGQPILMTVKDGKPSKTAVGQVKPLPTQEKG